MQIYYDDIFSLKGNNFDELEIIFKNEELFNEFKKDEIYNIRYPLLDNIRGEVVNNCEEYQKCCINKVNTKKMSILFTYNKKIYTTKQDIRKRIIESII